MSQRTSSNRRAPQAEGPESSAGDDFHLLWAARKALCLLEQNGSLKGLSVEGPAPADAVELDLEGDKLLGIDLGEYHGGESFAEADQVIHSQLKYSTRQPKKDWTAARLCRGKGPGSSKGSVVHRLAQVFAAHLRRHGREAVLKRLRLKLVSNQPVSNELRVALGEAQRRLCDRPDALQEPDLLKWLPGTVAAEMRRLVEAADLRSTEAIDFLRVLDLSDCGAGSRFDQNAALIGALGALGMPEAGSQRAALKQLIHDRMMPEARGRPPLTADDILPLFGLPSRRSLFPAEPRFEPLRDPIERVQLRDVCKALIEAGSKPFCLHAGAGRGKTTAVRLLERHLPESSVAVVFDSYGGGTYLDPAEQRHGHRRAILQIANELAVKTSCPLLLAYQLDPPDLLRELLRLIGTAAELVQAVNPNALVVVVVDAADNSVAAAQRIGERSFVQDLVRCQELPLGCRIVVTSRTHRRHSIGLPREAVELELCGFELPESTQHLRSYFPDADDASAIEFQQLSKGIPRVQGYALARSSRGLDTVLSSLRPVGKTVEDLIDEQFRDAERRFGSEADVEQMCCALVALPRPIPLRYTAELAGVEPAAVQDLCVDAWPGLRLDGELIAFRDEDFETHLNDRFGNDPSTVARAADLLSANQRSDAYAALHLASVLHNAGRAEELRRLVLEEWPLDAIGDPLERRAAFIQRARLALRTSAELEDRTHTGFR